MSAEALLLPCTGAGIEDRLAELADAGLAFLGRDTRVEPIAMITARFARTGTRLFSVRGRPGLCGVVADPINVFQAEIDIAMPGATEEEYVEVIAAALRLCATHLGVRSVLRYEPNRDDRAEHFERAGLKLLGMLRGARFQDGVYHDRRVWLGITG